jgi:YgiT-type zinc finger domain-containing protein
MKCLICLQAETVDESTSVTFERGEFRLVLNNVPARVCPKCGEAYVEEDVALNLLRDAERESELGELDVVREYAAGLAL